jgi:hypothetical protein
MPTVSHDTLHGFLPRHPDALGRALRIVDLDLPAGITTEALPTDASGVPAMFSRDMDTVLLVKRPDEAEPFILLLEAQTGVSAKKRTSWPYYVAYLRDKYKHEVVLLVLCVDAATAKWAAEPMTTGVGGVATQTTVAHVLGPDNVPRITSSDQASENLDFAAFSVWIHSRDADIKGILTAVGEALAHEQDKAARDIRAGLIEDGLGTERAREIWRAVMSTFFAPIKGTIVGDARIEGREEGREEGLELGKLLHSSSTLLRVLERRGLAVPEEVRERVTTCQDLAVLDFWLDRAIDAPTLAEVFVAPADAGRVPAQTRSPEQTGTAAEA